MQPLPTFERVHAPLAHWAAQRPQALALADEHGALDFETLHAQVRHRAAMLDAIDAPGHRLIDPDAATREQLVDVLATIASGRCAAVGDPDWPTAVREAVVQQLAALPATSSRDSACSPCSPFYIGYTSGSTGQPKGFRRHHRSWTESFRACVDTFGPEVRGTVLAPGRVSHSLFLFGMLLGLWTGAGSLVQHRHSAALTLATLADGMASVLVAVPSQLLMLLNLAQRRAIAPIAATRMVLISGAPWARAHTPALQALFPNARLIEFYGASETSFIAWQPADAAVPTAVVGRPFDGVEIEIRDRLQADDPASPGRIHVRSAMLFTDYVGTPDPATAAIRTPDAGGDWLSVRDQGRLDEHGRLWLHGRENRMLVTQGKNLFPEEVEAVLEAQPGIAAASVLGLPDAVRGKRVVAVLKLDDAADMADLADRHALIGRLIARLNAACHEALEPYKRPRRWWIAEASHWPQTRSGKTDHAALARALDVAEGSEPPWLHATS